MAELQEALQAALSDTFTHVAADRHAADTTAMSQADLPVVKGRSVWSGYLKTAIAMVFMCTTIGFVWWQWPFLLDTAWRIAFEGGDSDLTAGHSARAESQLQCALTIAGLFDKNDSRRLDTMKKLVQVYNNEQKWALASQLKAEIPKSADSTAEREP
jgi:hypothetical protein